MACTLTYVDWQSVFALQQEPQSSQESGARVPDAGFAQGPLQQFRLNMICNAALLASADNSKEAGAGHVEIASQAHARKKTHTHKQLRSILTISDVAHVLPCVVREPSLPWLSGWKIVVLQQAQKGAGACAC